MTTPIFNCIVIYNLIVLLVRRMQTYNGIIHSQQKRNFVFTLENVKLFPTIGKTLLRF